MGGTFGTRIQHLRDQVGSGHVVGTVEVDQVYAAWQHWHPEFDHPDGGGPYYLQKPLFSSLGEFMRRLADRAVTQDGSDVGGAMIDNMESLSQSVYTQAPWEFGDLRASGHPKVTHHGMTIYDRAPLAPRQTPSELAEKKRLSRLFNPGRHS